jgi:hypothetical protein
VQALVPHALAVTHEYQVSWLAQSWTPDSQPFARSVLQVAVAWVPLQAHWWFAKATHSGRGPVESGGVVGVDAVSAGGSEPDGAGEDEVDPDAGPCAPLDPAPLEPVVEEESPEPDGAGVLVPVPSPPCPLVPG